MSQGQYPDQPDPGQPPSPGQQFPPYQPQQYPAEQYRSEQYPTQQYPAQPYSTEQYPTQQYPAQGQAGYPYQSQPPAPGYAMAVPYSPYAPQALAPFGVDPMTGLPYSDKSKLVAGLLQIFLGGFGVGRFYLGNAGMAIAQIVVVFITVGFGYLWPLIDGIVLLAGNPRDRAGRPLRS